MEVTKPKSKFVDESDILAAADDFSAWDYGDFGINDANSDKNLPSSKPFISGLGLGELTKNLKKKQVGRRRYSSSSSSSDGGLSDDSNAEQRAKRKRKRMADKEFPIEDDIETPPEDSNSTDPNPPPSTSNPAVIEELRWFRNHLAKETTADEIAQENPAASDLEPKKIIVRVLMSGGYIRFPLLPTDSFQSVFDQLARDNECPANSVMLSRQRGKRISPSDTLAGVGIEVGDVLECFIDRGSKPAVAKEPQVDKNLIEVKFQTQERKTTKVLKVAKSTSFEAIRVIYAQQRGDSLDPSRIRFTFDGDDVELNSTPEELDMENGDCVDVQLVVK